MLGDTRDGTDTTVTARVDVSWALGDGLFAHTSARRLQAGLWPGHVEAD